MNKYIIILLSCFAINAQTFNFSCEELVSEWNSETGVLTLLGIEYVERRAECDCWVLKKQSQRDSHLDRIYVQHFYNEGIWGWSWSTIRLPGASSFSSFEEMLIDLLPKINWGYEDWVNEYNNG